MKGGDVCVLVGLDMTLQFMHTRVFVAAGTQCMWAPNKVDFLDVTLVSEDE